MPSPNPKAISKTLTLMIVTAAVLLLSGLFIYFAAGSKLKALSMERAVKQKELEDSTKIAQRLKQAEDKFVQTIAQLKHLEFGVTQRKYVPSLLDQLETVGKQVNLRVTSVRPAAKAAVPVPARKLSTDYTNPDTAAKQMDQSSKSESAQGTGTGQPQQELYNPIDVNVEVEGSFKNTMSFLYKITTFPKIITVNYIQMAPLGPPIGTNSPLLKIKLNLTAYVFRDGDKLPVPIEGPASATSRAEPDWRQKNEAG